MRLAYQGEPGAYSEAAALHYGGAHTETLPCKTFDEVFEAVVKKRATHGVVPLENSIGGTIHRNYDLLLEHELAVTGEVELDVVHCLQALPGTTLADVKVVYSHPQALAQCERYLRDLGVSVEAVYDTAGGAKLIAEQKQAGAAALASRRAAEVFGLEVLQEAVQDYEFNITRFAIIGGTPAADANKTTIVFALPSTPGRTVQGAQRLRAPRHQSHQARKPPDQRTSLGVSLLRRGGRAARRSPLRARAHPSRRVRALDARARDLQGSQTGGRRSETPMNDDLRIVIHQSSFSPPHPHVCARVTDPDDERLADYRNVPDPELLERRGVFVAEGRLVVRRLLTGSRFTARSVMVTETGLASLADALEDADSIPVYVVPQPLMNDVTGFNIHRGCLAIGERRADDDWRLAVLARRDCLVALERVGNADNVGSVFRNAAAFGVDAVLIGPACADPLYRKAIRTSMGAVLSVPFARALPWPQALHELRD